MPELPEVETTCRGISQGLLGGKTFQRVIVRNHRLRYPVPRQLPKLLHHQPIHAVTRRGKYILVEVDAGWLMIHLGMSGCLRLQMSSAQVGKHDHIDFVLSDQTLLRFTDPRRFGMVLWTETIDQHPLLSKLGVEPLSAQFNAQLLYAIAKGQSGQRGRHLAVKSFLMDSHVVVGIGNIYATEALYAAKILPTAPANQLTLKDYQKIVRATKRILRAAIKAGGTTLKDFYGGDGKPGYFRHNLKAYGRGGLACLHCHQPLKVIKINQRTTVYCQFCQT